MALEPSYRVKTFPSAEDALRVIKESPPDLVLLDVRLPGMSGTDALKEIKSLSPDTLVIMITAYEDYRTVISAMKLGAYDYVVKPIHMETLELNIRNALETIRLRKEVQALQEKYLGENLPFFIGESDAIQKVMELANAVAMSPDTPVLILGETGTGKEFIAGSIHYKSPNFRGPFIALNCASIPNDLVESEIFGYEKGAFSGARIAGKEGLIEQAEAGSLFLDEIGDLSLEAQAKLLRFLETGDYYRVGGTKKVQVKTRIISATNKRLEAMVEDGRFREDLYYRLAVIKIEIPPLSQRRDDIIPIARHFLLFFGRKYGKPFASPSPEVEDFLINYNWKGNVRELKNVIERAVLIDKGPELTLEALDIVKPGNAQTSPRGIAFPSLAPTGADLSAMRESMDRYYFEEALKLGEGSDSKAAQLLNLNYYTFRRRKKQLGLK